MTLQNRVRPDGEIVEHPARGTMMGNRGGRIHGPDRTLSRRRWASRAWISCVLDFKGRHRTVMSPNSYTELFFLDEATALAAGHRPCFECRRHDANGFAAAWASAFDLDAPPRVAVMDRQLQDDRVGSQRNKQTYRARLDALPDGAFIRHLDDAWLVSGATLRRWRFTGYDQSCSKDELLRDHPILEVLTPRCIVSVLTAGYRPMVHATADALA